MGSTHVVLAVALVAVFAGPGQAERTYTRLSPEKPGDQFWSFTVKVERLRETEAGDFLGFRVTATPTAANTHPLPRRSATLEILQGDEFISSCGVQPTGSGRELTFSFRIAMRYAAKSRFVFGESVERSEFAGGRYYWFHLGDFIEGKADPTSEDGSGRKGVPRISVEELAAAIRKEGFQWRHIGRQIAFTAVVEAAGAAPRVRIEGMDKGKFDTAVLYRGGSDNSVKVGQRVKVRGLVVDQAYGVWQVWCHECSAIDAGERGRSGRSSAWRASTFTKVNGGKP